MTGFTGTTFPNLPLNTDQIYTSAIDKSGCEVYLPAVSVEDARQQKINLQNFLNNQPEPKRARA